MSTQIESGIFAVNFGSQFSEFRRSFASLEDAWHYLVDTVESSKKIRSGVVIDTTEKDPDMEILERYSKR